MKPRKNSFIYIRISVCDIMSKCKNWNCECETCTSENDHNEPIQIEHNIRVTHVQRKEVHHHAPRKSSERVVSKAGECLNDPDSCSIRDVKAMAASILSVSQCHDDPVFKSGGVFVEEYVDDDYDDEDEDWEDYEAIHCSCGNLAAMDCENDSCGRCCGGCSRHN